MGYGHSRRRLRSGDTTVSLSLSFINDESLSPPSNTPERFPFTVVSPRKTGIRQRANCFEVGEGKGSAMLAGRHPGENEASPGGIRGFMRANIYCKSPAALRSPESRNNECSVRATATCLRRLSARFAIEDNPPPPFGVRQPPSYPQIFLSHGTTEQVSRRRLRASPL